MSVGRRPAASGSGTSSSGRVASPAGLNQPISNVLNGRYSARSTDSDVSDLLTVSSVATGNKRKKHVRSASAKSPLPQPNNVLHSRKPTESSAPLPRKSSGVPKGKAVQRPAWALKPPPHVDDDTPRSDATQDTYALPQRPSIDDFLELAHADQPVSKHQDSRISSAVTKLDFENRGNVGQLSLLQLLSADSARSSDKLSVVSADTVSELRSDLALPHRYGLKPDDRSVVSWNTELPKKNSAMTENFSMHSDSQKHGNVNTAINRKSDVSSKAVTKGPPVARSNSVNLGPNKVRTDTKGFDDYFNPMSLRNKTDDFLIQQREDASRKIQRWYRRLRIRRTAGAAAMKRMLASKREQVESRLSVERHQEHEKQLAEYEQMQRREEKARQARQDVINDLQSRREAKKRDAVHKKQLQYMQPSGKVSKRKAVAKKVVRGGEQTPSDGGDVRHPSDDDTEAACLVERRVSTKSRSPSPRPGTASSVGRKLDEIFESSVGTRTSASTLSGAHSEQSTLINVDTKSSRTTFDDLMNTLKELEEDPPELSKSSRNVAALWGGGSHNRDGSTKSLESNRPPGALLTADKLKSIMNFLDEVEKVEDDVRSEVSKSRELLKSVQVYGEERAPYKDASLESASRVATDISNAIAAQKDEIDHKQKTVEMLKQSLHQQKEFTTMQMREMDKEHKQQLSIQRQDYEATIKRHLSFIDQLIEDKKVLSQRCEELVTKLKESDAKYSSKIKQIEESHAVELKRQKDVMEAAEKLRREKWVQEKTQQIKEMTVKGLEPDIQKLIAKHKAEIKKIKATSQGEVLEADERVSRKYIHQMEELRAQYEQEKDAAIQRERDVARQRYEKQLEQEEESYQQQRRRLYGEIQEEKQRLADSSQKLKSEMEEIRSAAEETQKQALLKFQEEHRHHIVELERKHESDMKKYREQLDIEKQQWIENYMKKQDTYLLTKERELKEGVREARDKEIEMVIARLEQETAHNREEAERAAESRIRRIRDKYDREVQDLENSERAAQIKCNEYKEQVSNLEAELLRLGSQVKVREQELIDTKKLTERLQEERGKVTDVIRQEFADRLAVTEEESRRLRVELCEAKSRHRVELDRVASDKADEMEEVHSRVKRAIAKKEEVTQLLRQQLSAAEKRAEHLEQLLADQRKKLLS